MQAVSWEQVELEQLNDKVTRQMVNGDGATIARLVLRRGYHVPRHSHVNEQITMILDGSVKFIFDDGEALVRAGELLVIPSQVPHAVDVLEDTIDVDFFTPRREDWIRKEDAYLRSGGPAPQK